MELANLLTALIVFAAVFGIGAGAMIYAYIGSGSISVLFKDPIQLPSSLPPEDPRTPAIADFQAGYDAYQNGNYRQAVEKFSSCLKKIPGFAQAYHNRGLAFANLRQDDNAVRDLLRADEFYMQNGDREGVATIKQHLEAIKARKQAREA